MNSFDFGRPVQICGKTYRITSDMERAGKAMQAITNVLKEGDAPQAKWEYAMRKTLDVILGDGAYEDIFGGRPFSPRDISDLFNFIRDEVEEWTKTQDRNVETAKAIIKEAKEIKETTQYPDIDECLKD